MISLGDNDNHFITFCKETGKEANKNMKNLRRFQTRNTDTFLKVKFWVWNNEELAKKLGIDTENGLGDLYVVKECTEINQLKPTHHLSGKGFYVKKVNNILDTEKATEYFVDIISIALAFTVITHDFMSFAQLYSKYRSPSLVVFCEKDHPDYEKIVTEVYKARQSFPLKLNKSESNENPNRNLTNNMLFIISTQPMLIPLLKLSDKTPRVILSYTEFDSNDIIDLRDSYWKHIQKIDGMSKDEFFKRVGQKLDMKDASQDERESARAKFSEDRFKFSKAHSFTGDITADNITKFIEAAQKNKLKYYFESEPIPEETYSKRVVGEDFKKRVLQSDHDCVVYLEHPNDDENRDYGDKYERYVKNNKSSVVKFYRIKAYNETDVFKFSKYTAPSVLYFKKGEKDSPQVLDIKRDLLVGSKRRNAFDRLNNFINKCADD